MGAEGGVCGLLFCDYLGKRVTFGKHASRRIKGKADGIDFKAFGDVW